MAELQIKTEYLPERCEICHQVDFFDAKSNYCSRCSGVTDLLKNDNQETSSPFAQEIAGYRYRLARQLPRLLSGLWFSIAALIPIIFFLLKFSELRISDVLVFYVILPVSTAALWGSTIGPRILD